MLVFGWNFEEREDQNEDKKVIDRERQLDQVAGEKLETSLRSLVAENYVRKDHRQRHPDAGPDPRFSVSYSVSLSV